MLPSLLLSLTSSGENSISQRTMSRWWSSTQNYITLKFTAYHSSIFTPLVPPITFDYCSFTGALLSQIPAIIDYAFLNTIDNRTSCVFIWSRVFSLWYGRGVMSSLCCLGPPDFNVRTHLPTLTKYGMNVWYYNLVILISDSQSYDRRANLLGGDTSTKCHWARILH